MEGLGKIAGICVGSGIPGEATILVQSGEGKIYEMQAKLKDVETWMIEVGDVVIMTYECSITDRIVPTIPRTEYSLENCEIQYATNERFIDKRVDPNGDIKRRPRPKQK